MPPQTSNPYLSKYILPQIDGPCVLDVGCGAGLYAFLLKICPERTKHKKAFYKVDGLDFSKETCNFLLEEGHYDNVYYLNAEKLPFENNSYNTVLSIENLEHLYEEELMPAIKELYRVCCGTLIISTPPKSLVGSLEWAKAFYKATKEHKNIIPYSQYKEEESKLHKSCIDAKDFIAAGFSAYGDSKGNLITIESETCVYFANKKDINLEKLQFSHTFKRPIVEEIVGKDYKEELLVLVQNQIDMAEKFLEKK